MQNGIPRRDQGVTAEWPLCKKLIGALAASDVVLVARLDRLAG